MLAESAIDHLSFPKAILFGITQLTLILSVVWFGTRQRREDFRFSRVFGLTLLCLSSSLPFALVAYLLWPWDSRTWTAPVVVFFAALSPVVTVYIISIIRKRRMMRK